MAGKARESLGKSGRESTFIWEDLAVLALEVPDVPVELPNLVLLETGFL